MKLTLSAIPSVFLKITKNLQFKTRFIESLCALLKAFPNAIACIKVQKDARIALAAQLEQAFSLGKIDALLKNRPELVS